MTGLIILAVWFGLGIVGWWNGERYYRRVWDCDSGVWPAIIVVGPFNLVTFAMFGWNLTKAPHHDG